MYKLLIFGLHSTLYGLIPPVRLLIFEILSQLRVTIAFQDEILQSLIGKMLIFMPTYWFKLRLSVHKY